jgi:hypothetical protein
MSAITKPLIIPDAAATAGSPVAAEKVASYFALNRPQTRPDLGSGFTSYQIVFTIQDPANNISKQVWEYADSTDRDAGLALVANTIGAIVE